jgi:DNA-binding NarL/FixJ family response regulator
MDSHDSGTCPIRVLLVDDHPVVRVGLRLALEQDARVRVVGEATTGREALRVAEETTPDVAIVDLNLPDIGGLQVTQTIKQRVPDARVLVVSASADPEHIVGLLEAGADGYLPKRCQAEEFGEGVLRVHAGERVVHQSLLGALIAAATGQDAAPPPESLSPREREVLGFLADGATSKEIAAVLGLRSKTVENHRARILDKLDVANSAAAVRVALARGLVEPSRTVRTGLGV